MTANLPQDITSSTFRYVCNKKVDYWLIMVVMPEEEERFCSVEVEEKHVELFEVSTTAGYIPI